MKKEFRFEDYKGKYAMNCKTKEEDEEFRKLMHDNGRTWWRGTSYLKYAAYWYWHEEDTCYCFNDGTFGSLAIAIVKGYKILNWSDFKGENNEK